MTVDSLVADLAEYVVEDDSDDEDFDEEDEDFDDDE
jgi:hypothetical protein